MRIGIIAEGTTDQAVLENILKRNQSISVINPKATKTKQSELCPRIERICTNIKTICD
jgi:hypothetical protein